MASGDTDRGQERRVLGEDAFLHPAQPGAWVDPEPLPERGAGPPVGVERVALAALAVEGEDEQFPEPLPVRPLDERRLGLPHRVGGISRVDRRLDQRLRRRPAEFDEARRLGRRVRRVDEVGEGHRRAPQSERVAQRGDALRRR